MKTVQNYQVKWQTNPQKYSKKVGQSEEEAGQQ